MVEVGQISKLINFAPAGVTDFIRVYEILPRTFADHAHIHARGAREENLGQSGH